MFLQKAVLIAISGIAVMLFDAPVQDTPRTPPAFPAPDGIVFDIAFDKTGDTMAIACLDKVIRVFDWKTGQLVKILGPHGERVWSVAFSPDGKRVAGCTGEYRQPNDPGEVRIWDLATGKEVALLEGHGGLVFSVAFSPDGKTVYAGCWDGSIKAWDVEAKKERAILKGHDKAVRRLVVTPDKMHLVSAGFDGTVRYWNFATHAQDRSLPAHESGVGNVVFSHDGKLLITCSRPNDLPYPGVVKIWDNDNLTEKMQLTGPTGWTLGLAVAPDGSVLAAGGGKWTESGEIKLFHLPTGKELATFAGTHKQWVESVAFRPSGQWLVSGGGYSRTEPGELHVWDVQAVLKKNEKP